MHTLDLGLSLPPSPAEAFPDEYRNLPAISIHQPWADSIIYGGKDIENRGRRWHYRGLILIHASKGMEEDIDFNGWTNITSVRNIPTHWAAGKNLWQLQRGGIIGIAEITDCVASSKSPWFVGEWGLVLKNPKPLPFTPCRGALSLFYPLKLAA